MNWSEKSMRKIVVIGCYFAKMNCLHSRKRQARAEGYHFVADGTIVDDLGDHRPGLQAAEEHAIRHPLLEAQFDKELVRSFAKTLGLPTWNNPRSPAWGSRFSVGTRVTQERVEQCRL